MKKTDIQIIRDDILAAALPHVIFDGWTWDGVEKTASEAGYDGSMARAVFPDTLIDVVAHFSDLADRKMLQQISKIDSQNLRVRERIRTAVIARYEFLNLHKEEFRSALQFWTHPVRKVRATKIVWATADKIWDWAGDVSQDYNRYTKRALLSGILASSSLVFINDADEGLDNTKAFVDRRIENVMKLGSVIGKFSRKG